MLLSYAGQTAVVVDGEVGARANPFFVLCPAALQIPQVARPSTWLRAVSANGQS